MKRSLFFCIAALLAGVYVAYFRPDVLLVVWLFFILFVLFVSLFFTKRGRLPFFMLLCFLVGAFYLQNANDLANRPLYSYLNEYITITADVVEKPVYDEEDETHTITAMVHQVSFLHETAELEEKVQLTVPAGEAVPAFGETFTAVVLFYIPQENMNQGGFDYALYLKTKKIYFKGTVESGTVEIVGTFPLGIKEKIYQFNDRCAQVLTKYFPREAASVLQAVSLGNKSMMSQEMKDSLQISGLSHVTAVSGMHVTSLVSFLYLLFKLLKRNQYKFIWLTGGVILFFMLFTGATPSVVRASIMGLFVLFAYLFYREADPLTSLAVAAGILVFYNPMIAFDAGFILSFAATLGILLFADGIIHHLLRLFRLKGRKGWLASVLRGLVSVIAITVSSYLMMLPISAWIFGYVSLWGFMTSCLVTILAPVILVVGLLVSILGLIHPFLAVLPAGFGYLFVKLFLGIIYFFGENTAELKTVASFSLFGLYVYGLFLFLVYSLLYKRFKHCIVLALSLTFLLFASLLVNRLAGPEVKVTFINVGQGDCALLQLPGHVNVLIDGGGTPAYQGNFDVGKQIVLPYLRKHGIRKLDYVIASHPHEDHINGLFSILDYMKVETLVIPPYFDEKEQGAMLLEKAQQKVALVQTVDAGDKIELAPDCAFWVLVPDENCFEIMEEENDRSLVAQFSFLNHTVLFMGDAEEEAEAYLTEMYWPLENTKILKVAHHGSDNSSGEEFLQWANPEYAYIPCGRNSFGHPGEETLERLAAQGTVVYRADQDKDVTFTLDKEGIRSIRKGGKAYDED